MTRLPRAFFLPLPVTATTLPEPRSGLVLTETGELMLSVGSAVHAVQLSGDQIAWLAGAMIPVALNLDAERTDAGADCTPSRVTHPEAGHA